MRLLSIPTRTLAMVVVLATTGAVGCHPTSEPPSAAVDRPGCQAETLNAEDILHKGRLEAEGEAAAGEHAVLWIPRGTFARDEAEKLLGQFQQGIVAAKMKIGRPDWNHRGDRRVYFYLPDDQFISHASDGNCAFIPLWRVKQRQAPWLHEALHLLLGSARKTEKRMPLWLQEGLADALAIDVSLAEGLEYYSPLIDAPIDQLDTLAARALREAPSPEVLAAIGGRGRLPELFGPQRVKFAVPFYSGSASFVRFIAKRHGYQPLLAAIDEIEQEHETLEQETGESVDSMKAAWLTQIGY